MSTPRYKPYSYLSTPGGFGRDEGRAWKVDLQEDQTVDQREAAKFQHHYAIKIRRRAQQKFGSLEGYAEACGVPVDRLVKVMRGEAIMRIEDLVRAERVLGSILTSPTPHQRGSL